MAAKNGKLLNSGKAVDKVHGKAMSKVSYKSGQTKPFSAKGQDSKVMAKSKKGSSKDMD